MPTCKKHKKKYELVCFDCQRENIEKIYYTAGATREKAAQVIAHHLVQNNLAAAHDLLNRLGHAPVNRTESDNKIEIIITDFLKKK